MVDDAGIVLLAEALHTVCEETEGCADNDALAAAVFQILRGVHHALAGGNHIVDDQHILVLHARAEELVGHNRVAAVDDL